MTSVVKPKILVLTGSIRPGRFNIQPATWITQLGQARDDLTLELIDLKELNLPFLDEPIPPSQHKYSQDHTFAWSKTINAADGFIFVTPEYNHGISPVLKNAVDYLFSEWHFKPIAFISYGSLAGGARAVEHWRGISAELKMYDLREQIMLPDYCDHTNEQGEYQFTETHEKLATALLDSLVFWARIMTQARAELTP
jgi:NAD(P)H-dependent FMN reductase